MNTTIGFLTLHAAPAARPLVYLQRDDDERPIGITFGDNVTVAVSEEQARRLHDELSRVLLAAEVGT